MKAGPRTLLAIILILILITLAASIIVLYTRWTERKPPGNVLMNYGNIEAHENTVGSRSTVVFLKPSVDQFS